MPSPPHAAVRDDPPPLLPIQMAMSDATFLHVAPSHSMKPIPIGFSMPDLPTNITASTPEAPRNKGAQRASKRSKPITDAPHPKKRKQSSVNWKQREPKLMAFVTSVRMRKAAELRHAAKQRSPKFDALANSWDYVHILREGNKVKRGSKELQRWHPQQYTVEGVLRVGFNTVGKGKVVRGGLDGTQHQLAMLSSTASIACTLQDRKVSKEVGLEHDHLGFVLCRYYDGTPIDVVFANLQSKLIPFARYLHQVGDEMKLLTWEQYSKLGKATPRRGTVELFAQIHECRYTDSLGATHQRKLLIPPMLLQNGKASSIFSGVEQAIAALSTGALAAWKGKRFVLLHENPDNLAANVRKLHYTASILPFFILMILGGCICHRLSRLADVLFETEVLVGDIYSLAFVCQIPTYFNRLQRYLWRIVCDELVIIDGTLFPPDPVMKEKTLLILKFTSARGLEFVRGQIDGTGLSFKEAPGLQRLEESFAALVGVLNGDIRIRRLLHICMGAGCCTGLADTRNKVFGAINSCNLLLGGHSQLPRKDRIHHHFGIDFAFGSVLSADPYLCLCLFFFSDKKKQSRNKQVDGYNTPVGHWSGEFVLGFLVIPW